MEKIVVVEKLMCGGIDLYRAMCPTCQDFNLSANSNFICTTCNAEYTYGLRVDSVRMVSSVSRRRQFGSGLVRKIAKQQNNKCYWCGREFDTHIIKHDKIVTLTIHIDHIIPFAYSQNNTNENFVASCNICNLFKGDKVFDNNDDCVNFLTDRWRQLIKSEKIKIIDDQEKISGASGASGGTQENSIKD